MPGPNNINGPSSSHPIQVDNNNQSKEPEGNWGARSIKNVEVGKKELVTKGSSFKPKSRKDRVIEALDQIRLPSKSNMGVTKKYYHLVEADYDGIAESLGGETSEALVNKLYERDAKSDVLKELMGQLNKLQGVVDGFKSNRSDILAVYSKVDSRYKRKWAQGDKIQIPTAEVGEKEEYQVVSSSSKANKRALRDYLDNSDVGALYQEHLNNKVELGRLKAEVAEAKKELSLISKQAISLYIQERRETFKEQKDEISETSKEVIEDIKNYGKSVTTDIIKEYQNTIESSNEKLKSSQGARADAKVEYEKASKEKSKFKMSFWDKAISKASEKNFKSKSKKFEGDGSGIDYRYVLESQQDVTNTQKAKFKEASESKSKHKNDMNDSLSESFRLRNKMVAKELKAYEDLNDLKRQINIKTHWCNSLKNSAVKAATNCMNTDIDNFKKLLDGRRDVDFESAQLPYEFNKEYLAEKVGVQYFSDDVNDSGDVEDLNEENSEAVDEYTEFNQTVDETIYQNVEANQAVDEIVYQNVEPNQAVDEIVYQNVEPNQAVDKTIYQNVETNQAAAGGMEQEPIYDEPIHNADFEKESARQHQDHSLQSNESKQGSMSKPNPKPRPTRGVNQSDDGWVAKLENRSKGPDNTNKRRRFSR